MGTIAGATTLESAPSSSGLPTVTEILSDSPGFDMKRVADTHHKVLF